MAITAALVKELRDMTGAGMMDCKKALEESNGDTEAAVDWLRTKGLAKAAKKAGRVAAEGLVGLVTDGAKGAMVEVNSETDFVARNEQFQSMVSTIAGVALGTDGSVEAVAAAAYPGTSHSVADEITETVGRIGENMTLRRSVTLDVGEGAVGAYVHTAVAEGLGKIGILVGLKSAGSHEPLAALGKQIAMHIAAAQPLAVSPEELDQEIVARERAVFKEQAIASGKPAEIAEKMVEGRMRKYYEEVCLLSQAFVMDPDNKVADVLKKAEADVGAPITLTGFARFLLGDGVEREDNDFAAEVAATAGKA